jgi:hypothetical protein
MMIRGTSLQLASVAVEPNWSARLRLDSGLVGRCAGAAGSALAADSLTLGNQR